ncbi:divalent-cation tolerance protein CutA [Allochromatium palmeri]|uniref:Divalent cation tolerance protein CutA n=1 Tax=Allochromatium palmeri TaxID=231048 RepID=A0A6N8ED72_9GAMM|nr:divalent-cation tolerance protein CutA [Allochromatium palmeri]MTW22193.1 divalent cation tolerance protein CutA [Allochromatium palmeri]
MSTHYRLILCTCPDQNTALRLAEALVEERLAACASLVPGLTSVYRWDGRIQHDSEVLLLIKSVEACVEPLTERLRQLHPYDVPEIIALPIVSGSSDYLNWVSECVNAVERDS